MYQKMPRKCTILGGFGMRGFMTLFNFSDDTGD